MGRLNIRERPIELEDDFSAALHPIIRRIYLARGLQCDDEVTLGLKRLHHPTALKGIDQAVALLAGQVRENRRLLIVGDFDADGATSTALSLLCLRAMGYQNVDYLVPNRFEYGYGLTPEIVDAALERQPDMIMTVDNGVACHAGIARAQEAGVRVLVTDHHLPAATLPPADAMVNPNLPDCEFPSKALAGVGVVFYLMSALRAYLREDGWFEQQSIPEPGLAQFLDIVALGTVADVVPLDHNNRCLVDHGLRILRQGLGRPGIRALLEVAGRNPASVQAADLGFAAGPRLNAAGRLDDISVGIECLLSDDPMRAQSLARMLDEYNRDRRNIEQEMQTQAMASLEALDLESGFDGPGICLYNPDWHQGVIGILASRLKERFHRPVIAFADAGQSNDDGVPQIKGSARSIPGLHMRDLLDIIAKSDPDLLSRYGGHAMAAGLSLNRDDFARFHQAYLKALDEQLHPELLEALLYSDGELTADCFTLEFAEQLQAAGPWGQAFPEPTFHGRFRVVSRRILGDRHLKLVLSPVGSEQVVDAIAFNLDPELLNVQAEWLELLYQLQVNEFRGRRSPQLLVQALAMLDD